MWLCLIKGRCDIYMRVIVSHTACDHWQSGLVPLLAWAGEIFLILRISAQFSLVFVCCFVVNWKDYWQFSHCFAKFLSNGPRLSKYLPLVLTLCCNSMLLTAAPCDSDIKAILDLTNVWSNCWAVLQQWCREGLSHPDSLQSKQAHCPSVTCL